MRSSLQIRRRVQQRLGLNPAMVHAFSMIDRYGEGEQGAIHPFKSYSIDLICVGDMRTSSRTFIHCTA